MNKETKIELINKLGENLPFLRKKMDLTQDELAKKIGVTRITINTIEKNKHMTWGRFTSIMMILTSSPEMCRTLKQLGIYHPELNSLFAKSKVGINDSDTSTLGKSQFALVKQFAEYMPTAFYVFTANESQDILFFNNVLVEYLGYDSKEELIRGTKGSFIGLCHPDDFKNALAMQSVHTNDNNKKAHVTHRAIDKNGNVKWFDTYFKYVEMEKIGPVLFSFSTDITEQIARRVSSQLYREETKEEMLEKLENVDTSLLIKKKFLGIEILLADGNPESLEDTKRLLESEGAIVTTAETGKKAVSLAKKKPFNIILIDVIMPVLNGTQAIKQIATAYNKKNINCPIIAMTDEQTDTFAQNNIDAGAFDFIYKPLNINELSSIIIEFARKVEHTMKVELEDAVRSANTDPLTKVKSAMAFAKDRDALNALIEKDPASASFAVVVCDCDNLKGVNDTFGHSAGDTYIKNCCKMICEVFSHSPVYRCGGDEFVAILQNKDLKEHQYLMKKLEQDLEVTKKIPDVNDGRASMSVGIAIYDRRIDTNMQDTQKRADVEMYKVKKHNHEEAWRTLLHHKD